MDCGVAFTYILFQIHLQVRSDPYLYGIFSTREVIMIMAGLIAMVVSALTIYVNGIDFTSS
jgi:hypothetical protein